MWPKTRTHARHHWAWIYDVLFLSFVFVHIYSVRRRPASNTCKMLVLALISTTKMRRHKPWTMAADNSIIKAFQVEGSSTYADLISRMKSLLQKEVLPYSEYVRYGPKWLSLIWHYTSKMQHPHSISPQRRKTTSGWGSLASKYLPIQTKTNQLLSQWPFHSDVTCNVPLPLQSCRPICSEALALSQTGRFDHASTIAQKTPRLPFHASSLYLSTLLQSAQLLLEILLSSV